MSSDPNEGYKSLKIYDTTHDKLKRLMAIKTLKGEPVYIVALMDDLISHALDEEESVIAEERG